MSFQTVIGLEVHVELATRSKIFCSCTTEFGGEPNTHCCPVCTGMPGTLPTLNKNVLEFAIKAGLALGCNIKRYNKFDRKNYFYPDLPKAYQISQLYLPFANNGNVKINLKSGQQKNIRIHEIHMEEDAGKLIHSDNGETLIDYNRCGVPLIEIVTEPDFSTSAEVITFLEKIKSIFEYMGISDCKMQEGSMRVDVNLSVKEEDSYKLGTRTEMKNLNSFKAIERAIKYESQRQIDLINHNKVVVQETRRWDDDALKSLTMRSKENAHDYRYFPEPDIPPLDISDDFLDKINRSLPEFAEAKAARFVTDFGLAAADALIITRSLHLAQLFEDTVNLCKNPKEVRFWIINQIMYLLNEKGMEPKNIKLTAKNFAKFIDIVLNEKINRQTGKTVFEKMLFCDTEFDIEGYIEENNLEQVDNTEEIRGVVLEVINNNPKTLEQYKSGQTKVVGFFVGQVMKATGGKAKPDTVNKLINEELSKL